MASDPLARRPDNTMKRSDIVLANINRSTHYVPNPKDLPV